MYEFATIDTARAMVARYGDKAPKLFGSLAGGEGRILAEEIASAAKEQAKADKPTAPAPAPKITAKARKPRTRKTA